MHICICKHKKSRNTPIQRLKGNRNRELETLRKFYFFIHDLYIMIIILFFIKRESEQASKQAQEHTGEKEKEGKKKDYL